MDTRVKPAYDAFGKRSIVLQQPLDVVELELRAGGVAEAAAQLFEDAADALHVDLAGDFHGEVVAEVAAAQRPAQRIAIAAAALLTAGAVAGAIVLAVAVAGLHLLRQVLRALAQRFQCLALRIHRAFRIALAEPAVGVAHRGVGVSQIVVAIALLAGIAVLALLALLTFLALLAFLALGALAHAAPCQLLLQFAQAVAQALLVLLQFAHVLVALLVAAHAVAAVVLALLEGLVAQLLLLADHVAELVQRLLHLLVAVLAGPRHLQV